MKLSQKFLYTQKRVDTRIFSWTLFRQEISDFFPSKTQQKWRLLVCHPMKRRKI